MTLKQRLAELLPHFDESGRLLPNKKVFGRVVSPEGYEFKPSLCDTIGTLALQMQQGNEYRIEDAPKRPREFWIDFSEVDKVHYLHQNKEKTRIRFIEDNPREVTDEDVDAAFVSESVAFKLRKPIKEVMRSILQHYENERNK